MSNTDNVYFNIQSNNSKKSNVNKIVEILNIADIVYIIIKFLKFDNLLKLRTVSLLFYKIIDRFVEKRPFIYCPPEHFLCNRLIENIPVMSLNFYKTYIKYLKHYSFFGGCKHVNSSSNKYYINDFPCLNHQKNLCRLCNTCEKSAYCDRIRYNNTILLTQYCNEFFQRNTAHTKHYKLVYSPHCKKYLVCKEKSYSYASSYILYLIDGCNSLDITTKCIIHAQ